MAGAGGIEGLHAIDGTCDLCGKSCDSETQELNALTCTFAPNCPEESSCYHQDCLERYLKNIRCEKNRKTGFKCPRGCGKGTAYDESCRGKIDKSHPIHVRNDNNKKRKKARMPEAVEVVSRFGPAAKAARAKERELEKAKQKKTSASAAAKLESPQPQRPKAAVVKKESLASAAAAARRELGLASSAATTKVSKAQPLLPTAARGHEELPLQRSLRGSPSAPATQTAGSVWGSVKAAAKPPPEEELPPLPPPIASEEAFPEVATANKPSVAAAKGQWARGVAAKTVVSNSATAEIAAMSAESLSIHSSPSVQPFKFGSAVEPLASPSAAIAAAPSFRDDVQKVSKAFKKNMRRAERKKEKEADASVSSEPSPPLTPHRTAGLAPAQSPDSSPAQRGCSPDTAPPSSSHDTLPLLPDLDLDAGSDLDHCLQVVAFWKLRQAAKQLQQLGFAAWQCALAVNLCSGLHSAATWLLQSCGGTKVSNCVDAQKMLDDAVRRNVLPEVDVTQEVGQLEAAATALDVPLPVVCAEVSRCEGDLRAALAALSSQPHQPGTLSRTGDAPFGSKHPDVLGSLEQQQQQQQPPSILGLAFPSSATEGVSLLQRPSSGCSRPSSTLVDANDIPLAALPARARGPIGPSVTSSASVSQPSHQAGRRSAGTPGLGSFESYTLPGSSAAPAAGMSSRVSSFDMLSVGAPWSALDSQKPQHHTSEASDRGASKVQSATASDRHFCQTSRPLPFHRISPSPFSGSTAFDTALPPRRPVAASGFHHQSPALFAPSPSTCFSTANGIGGSLGLDHYASALSSQPSWASTSSNLWGTPLPSSSCGFGDGMFTGSSAFDSQRNREMSDVPAAALLAAAAVASESDYGISSNANGSRLPNGGNSAAINDSELSALMATLMCR